MTCPDSYSISTSTTYLRTLIGTSAHSMPASCFNNRALGGSIWMKVSVSGNEILRSSHCFLILEGCIANCLTLRYVATCCDYCNIGPSVATRKLNGIQTSRAYEVSPTCQRGAEFFRFFVLMFFVSVQFGDTFSGFYVCPDLKICSALFASTGTQSACSMLVIVAFAFGILEGRALLLLDVVGCCWMLLDFVWFCWMLFDVVGCCCLLFLFVFLFLSLSLLLLLLLLLLL